VVKVPRFLGVYTVVFEVMKVNLDWVCADEWLLGCVECYIFGWEGYGRYVLLFRSSLAE